MKFLDNIKGVDIYLLDQLMKGKIGARQRILDAGCGKGRNLKPFLDSQTDFIAVDSNEEHIEALRVQFPEVSERFYTFFYRRVHRLFRL